MTLKGKSRTRQGRADLLKVNAKAKARARAKQYDRRKYDGHYQEQES